MDCPIHHSLLTHIWFAKALMSTFSNHWAKTLSPRSLNSSHKPGISLMLCSRCCCMLFSVVCAITRSGSCCDATDRTKQRGGRVIGLLWGDKRQLDAPEEERSHSAVKWVAKHPPFSRNVKRSTSTPPLRQAAEIFSTSEGEGLL